MTALGKAEAAGDQPRCPTCRGALVVVGNGESGIVDADEHRRHAYWCPAGCRGPAPDGTFDILDCPACGSQDTVANQRGDGLEEVECKACGTIFSLQMPRA